MLDKLFILIFLDLSDYIFFADINFKRDNKKCSREENTFHHQISLKVLPRFTAEAKNLKKLLRSLMQSRLYIVDKNGKI